MWTLMIPWRTRQKRTWTCTRSSSSWFREQGESTSPHQMMMPSQSVGAMERASRTFRLGTTGATPTSCVPSALGSPAGRTVVPCCATTSSTKKAECRGGAGGAAPNTYFVSMLFLVMRGFLKRLGIAAPSTVKRCRTRIFKFIVGQKERRLREEHVFCVRKFLNHVAMRPSCIEVQCWSFPLGIHVLSFGRVVCTSNADVCADASMSGSRNTRPLSPGVSAATWRMRNRP